DALDFGGEARADLADDDRHGGLLVLRGRFRRRRAAPPRHGVTSRATSPRPSMAKRTRSPGDGYLVVMLLPVITIMPRPSARPRRFNRFASHATASKGWPSASPVLPWPAGSPLTQQRVAAVSRSRPRQAV